MLRDRLHHDLGRAALLAVVLLAGAPAPARAGAGDDCCADLEERIAELEATTARKGNRKLNVTVSGWVNEALFRWDDGTQSNAYVGTNAVEQSRFKFFGEAKIDKDWSAGYALEIGVAGHPANQWNQFTADSVSRNPVQRATMWSSCAKTIGSSRASGSVKVAVGHQRNGDLSTFSTTPTPTMTRNVDDAEGRRSSCGLPDPERRPTS